MKRYLLVFCLFGLFINVNAQISQFSFDPDTMLTFKLDSDVVVFAKGGLTEQDFIDEILNDSLFYQGFKKMSKYSFISENGIISYNKKGKRTAHISKKIKHDQSSGKYQKKVLQQTDSGEVYKRNGNYNLFTVKMFSYIFENQNTTEFKEKEYTVEKNEKGEEGYKDKLKILIFSPGKPIKGIPLISNKTAIFTPEMQKYYDYKFYSGVYRDIPVYRFKCTVKPQYRNSGKVMIRELTTTFDKRNFQILGRYIDMSYDNPAFDFDVKMNIEMIYVGEDLLPVQIDYNGRWDIPFKSPEIVSFSIKQYDFEPKHQNIEKE